MLNWIKKRRDSIDATTVGSLSLSEQQHILIDWANNTDIKPKWHKEIMREISKMDKALSDSEFDLFIEELAKLKLGIGVTMEEANVIVELSKRIDVAKTNMENGGSRVAYDKARADLENYQKKIIAEP